MKTFTNFAAQGDVIFRRVESVPKDATKTDNKVVAHSETGHHHAFPTDASVQLFTTKDPMICYLQVSGPELAQLQHHRPFDTHETIGFSEGCYEIRRQREYTPEGWRRVED